MVTLSVRTCFDLFFQAVDFPPGSEVIMTCINIPDMEKIIRYHGLKPIPINLNFSEIAPSIDDIRKNINKNTKAIVISYIYGAKFNADDIIDLA